MVPNGTPDVSRENGARLPNRVLYLSNLVKDKGIVEAVEAALILVARHPQVEVLFAGDWDDASVERQLRERVGPANGRIRFLAPVAGEEKERLLQSASVLLFPPRAPEGHPRVVLEAICRGIPLVTTDRGAIRETVTDGESAFVLTNPDPSELADRVLELLADDDLRERMGSAARERYERDYTQETADRRLAKWLMSAWHEACCLDPTAVELLRHDREENPGRKRDPRDLQPALKNGHLEEDEESGQCTREQGPGADRLRSVACGP